MNEQALINSLARRGVRQADIAAQYAKLIETGGHNIDWHTVNKSIQNHWSLSGLIRVKRMAWRRVNRNEIPL